MGFGSVAATFVMCFLFNIFLPTSDVGSDINLMYQALTFNLGESLELSGCKSCYFKTLKDVYYPEIHLEEKKCQSLLYNPTLTCGRYLPSLNKIIEFQSKNETCSSSQTYILNNEASRKFETRKRDLLGDFQSRAERSVFKLWAHQMIYNQ